MPFLVYNNKDETTMYVNVTEQHFEIIVLKGNNLILYNTFEYSTKEDFIYYILFTAEQLELDPEAFPLVLIGNISENDNFYNIAYTYIRHVSVFKNRLKYTLEIENDEAFRNNFVLQNSF
ncbi:MAG: DUF3822 family protein [Flavobacteriaceae bacterium]